MNKVLGSKGIQSFGFSKDPGRGFAKYGITANSLPELLVKGKAALENIGQNIAGIMDKASAVTKSAVAKVNVNDLISPVDKLLSPENKIHIAPEMLDAIENAKNSLTNTFKTVTPFKLTTLI